MARERGPVKGRRRVDEVLQRKLERLEARLSERLGVPRRVVRGKGRMSDSTDIAELEVVVRRGQPERGREGSSGSAAWKARPARQARSRETLLRLLDAAERVMAERGLDRATVPAIARRAGVSVGSVYRRFPDKDALLRAVYERIFARARATDESSLDPSRWSGASPEQLVRGVVEGMIRGYERDRGLLRALIRYARAHPDARFRRRAESLNVQVVDWVRRLLEPYRDRITHPDPDAAIGFGLLMVAFVLRETVLSDESRRSALAVAPDRLGEELTRMYVGYLGLRPESPEAPAPS